jgi:hypothetical protein
MGRQSHLSQVQVVGGVEERLTGPVAPRLSSVPVHPRFFAQGKPSPGLGARALVVRFLERDAWRGTGALSG